MTGGRRSANPAASVRARLYNLAQKRGAEFQLVLSEYAIERLLYRLGSSSYRDRFVLKGAAIFKLWDATPHRATWDLDLLGRGTNTVVDVVAIFRDLCGMTDQDGIVFNPRSVKGEEIKAVDEYAGVRVLLEARLAEARIPVQVDVGFGDAVVARPDLAGLSDAARPSAAANPGVPTRSRRCREAGRHADAGCHEQPDEGLL